MWSEKKYFVQTKFAKKIAWKIFWFQKIFCSKKNFSSKKFLGPKIFLWPIKKCSPKNSLGSNFLFVFYSKVTNSNSKTYQAEHFRP